MKRYGFIISLIVVISSLFCIKGIFGYLISNTDSLSNSFTIKDTTSYTVIHKQMNLDGTTYTAVDEDTEHYDNIPLGTEVTPLTNTYEGFITPAVQTVELNDFNDIVITYLYDREICHLTVNDSSYVTGNVSGEYLYGTEIHLVADEYNSSNNPFVNWTNGVNARDYTFTITSDVTIGPNYADSYLITYVPNNGDDTFSNRVVENSALGSLPDVEYNDCTGTSGSYRERNCTYYYAFYGWYTEPEFVNQVNEQFVPTGDTTLYAKWNKIYFYQDSEVFNNDHLVDTGIKLFDLENGHKDFIASVIVSDRGQTDDRDVIFANMYEVGEPYQGVNFRWYSNRYNLNTNVRVGNKKNAPINYQPGQTITIRRINDILSYSTDGITFTDFQDYTLFDQYFDVNASFGGNYDNKGNPWRLFSGTLSEMSLEIIEPDTYMIKYDPNGGSGMMIDQPVKLNETVNLTTNAYRFTYYMFDGWNTEADGTGTSYADGASVTGLGNKDEVVTLYAQWVPAIHYFVHFDANGGVGTMTDQELIADVTEKLSPSTFTKDGYLFDHWSTNADGSGDIYYDEEEVVNLCNTQDDIITLYAQYSEDSYSYSGEVEFDGIDDYIDTGLNLFSEANINRDFDIAFDIIYVDPENSNHDNNYGQPTLLNGKDESYTDVWPGFVVRLDIGNHKNLKPSARWGQSSVNNITINTNNVPIHMEIKRRDGVIKVYYSYGATSRDATLIDQSTWEIDKEFPYNVTIGCSIINGQPARFFKGTLADISINIYD